MFRDFDSVALSPFSTRFNEIATHTPRARDAHHIKQEEVGVLVQPISALPVCNDSSATIV